MTALTTTNRVNISNVKQCIAQIVKGATALRGMVQEVTEFGLAHYAQHGDSTYLTKLLSETASCRTIRTATLQAYIEAHSNLVWASDKTKGNRFVSDGKQRNVTMPLKPWYEHDNKGEAKAVKLDSRVHSLLKAVQDAQVDGRLQVEDKAKVQAELAQVLALIA